MESTVPFELDGLRRDWIVGISGKEVYRRVCHARDSFKRAEEPVIIREKNPLAFAVLFFAAASLHLPIVLANPNWGAKEQEEFDQLMALGRPTPASILIPTGGTTGGVKLAIHDWASLRASALAVKDFLGGGAVDSCCVLPLHHVSGLMQLLRSFVSGGSIRFDEHATEGRCLSLVPTQLQRMMQSSEGIRKMSTAHVVFVGGAAMPRRVEQKARELELPVVPVYGMTETAAMIAAVPNQDFLNGSDSGAVPLGDTRFSIDCDGSVRIWSSSLFKGYHGGARMDSSGGFRTGDAGWLDGQRRLHLNGRMDRLINTGGEKVNPAEVRDALLRLEGIAQARVVGEANDHWGEVVVAYLKPALGVQAPDETEIRSVLKTQLSPYKIPKHIRFSRRLPSSGGYLH